MEEELQHAHRCAGDLRTSEVAEFGLANFVRDFRFGEFAFAFADAGDFWNRIDPSRNVLNEPLVADTLADMGRGEPALVVGGAC